MLSSPLLAYNQSPHLDNRSPNPTNQPGAPQFELGDIGPLLGRPPPLPPRAVLLRDKAAFCLGLALTWRVLGGR